MSRRLKLAALVAAGVMALYAIVGFLVIPAVARSQAVSILGEEYRLKLAIGKIRFNPFTFVARVEDLAITAPGGDRLLAFESLAANFELRSLFARALVFKSVALTQPYVHVHLRDDGSLNLAQAFAGRTQASPVSEGAERAAPPALIIDDVTLTGGDIHFTDNARGRRFDEHFAPLDLHLQHLSTRPEDRSDLVGLSLTIGTSGRLTVAGDLSAIPTRFDVKLAAQDIPLAIFQPYLAERLPAVISGGALSFDFALGQGLPEQDSEFALTGNTAITGLVIKLAERDDVVLAWDEMSAAGIVLDIGPNRLAIEEIAVTGLDTSFKVYSDGRTNISEVLRQVAAAETPSESMPQEDVPGTPTQEDVGPEGPAFPYAIKRITVDRSRLLFSDEQIRPDVRVQIDQLAGEILGISSDPEAQATAVLAGRVGEFGKAEMDGATRIAAPKSDLKASVAFDNVELTSFSPYAGKFAGYTIDKGKLFLDLRYTLLGGRLKGENHAVFDQFELGGKVDSEDATKLPVKFALSLLRDRKGRIDLNLPVEGDVDSPGFRLGPLIAQALVNLVTRIVTAPFTFLAELFGGGADMEYALFEPGSGTISAAEHDKILPLARALTERPRLLLEIQGWADPAADAKALRERKLAALLETVERGAVTPGDRFAPLPPSTAVLAAAYEAFFGAGAASAVQAELAATEGGGDEPATTRPDSDQAAEDGSVSLPLPAAFEAELRARLLDAQPVPDEELAALAHARGQQVMDVLVADGGIEAERVFVRRGEIAKAGEGARAKLILDAR